MKDHTANRMATPAARGRPGRPRLTEDPAWQPPQEILWGKACNCGAPFESLRTAGGAKKGHDGITAVRYLRCPACGKRHTLRVRPPVIA